MKARYKSLSPLVDWRERRPDWAQLFERKAPLHLEIGFGNGEYLLRYAGDHPEVNLVGVEITWGSVRRGLRRIAKLELDNALLLWEDARLALDWAFGQRSLDRVYSLFPCPWPKKRHAKNRLFQRPFLSLVNSRLVDGGEFMVVTDHADYRDQIIAEAESLQFEVSLTEVGPDFNTKYERKWQGEGQQEFFRICMTKTGHHPHPEPEALNLEKKQSDNFNPAGYAPQNLSGATTVEFKRFVFDPEKQIGLQEVITVEEALSQHFWIEIHRRGQQWWVQPASGCKVVPVASVQAAVDQVHRAMEASC